MMTDPNPEKPMTNARMSHSESITGPYQFRWMQGLVPGFLGKWNFKRLHPTRYLGYAASWRISMPVACNVPF